MKRLLSFSIFISLWFALGMASIIQAQGVATINIIKQTTPEVAPDFVFSDTIEAPFTFTLTNGFQQSFVVTPGTYTVTESLLAGWVLDGIDCTIVGPLALKESSQPNNIQAHQSGQPGMWSVNGNSVTITVEDQETADCTFTNRLATGSITITKQTTIETNDTYDFLGNGTPIDGSISQVDDFTLFGDDQQTFPDIPIGTYEITEINLPAGWGLEDITCSGGTTENIFDNDNNLTGIRIILADGDGVICTFQNNQTGQLTVSKIVSPTTDSGLFNLQIDGTDVVTDVGHNGSTTSQTVISDTYQVGETAGTGTDLFDYIPSIECRDGGGSGSIVAQTNFNSQLFGVPVNAGDDVVCIITNIRRGRVEIEKVTNPSGGTGFVFQHDLRGDPDSFILDDGQVETLMQVNPGSYSVTEDDLSVSGHTLTAIDCNDDASDVPSTFDLNTLAATVNVEEGETLRCTFTNSIPTLTVTKIVTNDNGGTLTVGEVPLFVDGNAVTSGVATTVTVGTHVVTETNPIGYTATFGGDCDESGNVTLAADENKVCIIYNDDIPASLTVTKVITNDNGGTLTVSEVPLFIDSNAVTSGVANTVNAGTYTVSETNPTGYTATFGGDCDAAGTVTVALGENRECIIYNDDLPASLTVTKVITNDNGGTLTVPEVSLFVDGNAVTSGVSNTVDAGTRVVSETNPTGYVQSFGGDCDSSGNVTLAPGENADCIIYNDDAPAILTLTKIITNDNGGTLTVTEVPLFVDGNPVTSGQANAVDVGTHNVSETNPTGYTATIGGDCDAGGTVTLAFGESKECIIFNDDRPATLTVIKQVLNDDGGTAGPGDFTINVNGTNSSLASFPGSESGTIVTLDAGAYTVTEDAVVGYSGSFLADCTGTIAVGESKTCTVMNDDIPTGSGRISIVKQASIQSDQIFGFSSSTLGNFTLVDDGSSSNSGTFTVDANSTHVVTETVPPFWTLISATCDNEDSVSNITVAEGESVICTFTNALLPANISVGKSASVDVATPGEAITYTYRITNSGDVELTSVVAVDDKLGNITIGDTTLSPGEETTGTASTTAQMSDLPGPLVNTVIATGTPPLGPVVTDSAQASVVLVNASISLVKTVALDSSDPACGTSSMIEVPIGSTVSYCYTVTNTGDVAFVTHSLRDDQLGTIFSDRTITLNPGASISTIELGHRATATLSVDTTNIATWTATTADPPVIASGAGTLRRRAITVQATAQAVVQIVSDPTSIEPSPEPGVNLRVFLPILSQ
ncbi:hypothetical protein KFU94_08940 [Chloroflexi bacterium TSY]|nr:hypothetical protein [Chloroflexi bacterium TSY]